MSNVGVTEVRVLEEAELVTTEKVGRARRCTLGPQTLEDEGGWIASYRHSLAARYDRLAELLEREEMFDG